MPTSADKPKRRWFRLSLRTLFVLLTVACLWVGWISHRADQQRQVVEWVTELNGYVLYDYEMDENSRIAKDADPPGPDWLRDLIGVDYFANVLLVNFNRTQVRDPTPLANLKSLDELYLYRTQVSQEDCEMLQKSLPSLNIVLPLRLEKRVRNSKSLQ